MIMVCQTFLRHIRPSYAFLYKYLAKNQDSICSGITELELDGDTASKVEHSTVTHPLPTYSTSLK